jgi:hypothetical protein
MVEIEFNLRLVERRGRSTTLNIDEPLSLPQLEAILGLKHGDVGMLLINGAWAPLDSVIKDGDSIRLYPYMEGG